MFLKHSLYICLGSWSQNSFDCKNLVKGNILAISKNTFHYTKNVIQIWYKIQEVSINFSSILPIYESLLNFKIYFAYSRYFSRDNIKHTGSTVLRGYKMYV